MFSNVETLAKCVHTTVCAKVKDRTFSEICLGEHTAAVSQPNAIQMLFRRSQCQ